MAKTRNAVDSGTVKGYGTAAGAAVVGIASSGDFGSAPEGHRPSDVLDGCLSVIILGIPFTRESLNSDDEYTKVRSDVIERTNNAAKEVAKRMKNDGYDARTVTGCGGKTFDGMTYGTISLKHAAELAGLGIIGKNYLLNNPEYGNLLWFSAVLTDAELTPDRKAGHSFCGDCDKCVETCPCGALNDISSFGRKGCAKCSFKMVDRKWMMDCFSCRSVCPHRFGRTD